MTFIARDPQTISDVLAFWSRSSDHWFAHDPQFDRQFAQRFAGLHRQADSGALHHWEETPEGCLALLILIDQYPRNAFRGTPAMYAHDSKALCIARQMIDQDFIGEVPPQLKLFCLLPFAHSEHFPDQNLSVELHKAFLPSGLDRARRHRKIIDRFGRFPHRNAILGRCSRPEETRYLQEGEFQG